MSDEDDTPEPDITSDNALVVIATELRSIRRTLHALAYDPNCETMLGRIRDELHDSLNSFTDRDGDDEQKSIAEHLRDIDLGDG